MSTCVLVNHETCSHILLSITLCHLQSYLDAMASGATASPSAPAVKSYLDAMSTGNAPAPTSGGGIASYLSALGSTNVLSGGSGISSYLDNVNSAPAVATSSAPAASGASYLSALGGTSILSGGAGISSHVNALGAGSSQLSGAGVSSYLDNVNSAPVVTSFVPATPASGASYLSALGSTNVLSGGAGMSSYLDNVNSADVSELLNEIENAGYSSYGAASPTGDSASTTETHVSPDGRYTTLTTTTVHVVVHVSLEYFRAIVNYSYLTFSHFPRVFMSVLHRKMPTPTPKHLTIHNRQTQNHR